MSISLVALDLDGVLCDFQPAKRLTYLADLTGRDPAWIKATIWDSDFEPAAEAGAYPTGDAYLRAFNQRLGFPLTREQWVTARRLAMAPRPMMIDLLRTLRPRVQLAVLTNNGALVRETLPTLVPELWQLLGERIHVSADFNARKPDPVVYQRLVERYGTAPSTVIFVDDSAANVEGARAAGLQAVRFETRDQLDLVLTQLVPG